jgi:CBS domain-containing protein
MLGSLVSDKTRIEKIMNKEVITADADADLFSAASIMTSKHVGGLPVTDEEELIGIVTERDIVDALI